MTFQILLTTATLLCSLTAGFVFAFATVVMPGLAKLDDGGFIRGFQVIDGIIQKGQPAFGLVWVGSMITLLIAAVLGFQQLAGTDRWLLIAATVVYLVGVQLPTLTINIPLNNQLQAVNVQDVEAQAADGAQLAQARASFEPRWNRWNVIRTVLAIATSLMLLVVILRL